MVHLSDTDDTCSDHEAKVKSELGVSNFDLPNNDPLQGGGGGGGSASSSHGHLKSYFVGMGFKPALVDRVLRENGEGNVNLLLESLFAYSGNEDPSTGNRGSSDVIFSDDSGDTSSGFSADAAELEELDVKPEINEDKRTYLLTMNFSVKEVDFAIDRLGEDAHVNELVDFIVASQIAESSGKNEEESLFKTMDRTLRLLQMGFTEDEISSAIERYGSDISVQELADSIFAKRLADTYPVKQEAASTFFSMHHSNTENGRTSLEGVKEEHGDSTFNSVQGSHSGNGWTSVESLENERTKRRSYEAYIAGSEAAKEDYGDSTFSSVQGSHSGNGWTSVESLENERTKRRSYEAYIAGSEASSSNPTSRVFGFNDIHEGKRPKREYDDDHSTFEAKSTNYSMLSQQKNDSFDDIKIPQQVRHENRHLRQSVAKPPYFLYGNVLEVSNDTWTKISQFLYAVAPEFANTQFFSALSRKEGYIHNLPSGSRSHILPRPAMTIEDAFPQTKPWWPSWDTRKQLSCICSETSGISQHCERLGKILSDSRGVPSSAQQTDIIHHCKTLNLVWVGKYKLSQIEPEKVEVILGYPVQHTEILRYDPSERLKSLKYSFQTDTLGYHLSVLKGKFPQGLTMLSLYSGIGGAEVALHRLGIRLKCVVSVEASDTNRKILKRWWCNSGQTGKLVQVEDINRMSRNKIENLMKDCGGFDFVVCQNPCACMSENGKMTAGLDFSMFYEFVRVLQTVRGPTGDR